MVKGEGSQEYCIRTGPAELDVHGSAQPVLWKEAAGTFAPELNIMTDPHPDDLNNRIRQLETSRRRWKKVALGTWVLLGLVVLSTVIVGVTMAQRIEAERDRAQALQRDLDEHKRQVQEALDKAQEELQKSYEALEKTIARDLLRPIGGGPGLAEKHIDLLQKLPEKQPKDDPKEK